MRRYPLTADDVQRARLNAWDQALRDGARFPCGDCGQMVKPTDQHTWDDCRAYEQEQTGGER